MHNSKNGRCLLNDIKSNFFINFTYMKKFLKVTSNKYLQIISYVFRTAPFGGRLKDNVRYCLQGACNFIWAKIYVHQRVRAS